MCVGGLAINREVHRMCSIILSIKVMYRERQKDLLYRDIFDFDFYDEETTEKTEMCL